MWNTCLIGRRWKPREGWSRPVLTGDGDTAFQPFLWRVGFRVFCCCWIVPGDDERWDGHEYDVDERFVSRPLAGSRTVTVVMPEWFPFVVVRSVRSWFLRWPWPRCDARSLSEPGS